MIKAGIEAARVILTAFTGSQREMFILFVSFVDGTTARNGISGAYRHQSEANNDKRPLGRVVTFREPHTDIHYLLINRYCAALFSLIKVLSGCTTKGKTSEKNTKEALSNSVSLTLTLNVANKGVITFY